MSSAELTDISPMRVRKGIGFRRAELSLRGLGRFRVRGRVKGRVKGRYRVLSKAIHHVQEILTVAQVTLFK